MSASPDGCWDGDPRGEDSVDESPSPQVLPKRMTWKGQERESLWRWGWWSWGEGQGKAGWRRPVSPRPGQPAGGWAGEGREPIYKRPWLWRSWDFAHKEWEAHGVLRLYPYEIDISIRHSFIYSTGSECLAWQSLQPFL